MMVTVRLARMCQPSSTERHKRDRPGAIPLVPWGVPWSEGQRDRARHIVGLGQAALRRVAMILHGTPQVLGQAHRYHGSDHEASYRVIRDAGVRVEGLVPPVQGDSRALHEVLS